MSNFCWIKLSKVNSGQALIAVILVMVVALTIGLSVATRNVTNLRLTTEEQSSQRALAAAEAGVEQAIQSSLTGVIIGATGQPVKKLEDAEIKKVEIKSEQVTEMLLNNGEPVQPGESVDVWLSTYPTYANPWSGSLRIFWQETGVTCTDATRANFAALDIYAVYAPLVAGQLQNAEVKHYAVDPCDTRRTTENNFCQVDNAQSGTKCKLADGSNDNSSVFLSRATTENFSGVGLKYWGRISFGVAANGAPQPGLLVRITPLYASTVIGVKGYDVGNSVAQALPAQGATIESTGTSGQTQRKIVVRKPYPRIPNEMFYTIFSP